MGNDVTIANQPAKKRSLVEKFAEKFSIEPDKLLATLKATAFRQRGDAQISNEQMASLLIVADQYGLNPFTKEIYAFDDKGAIVPVVSVDGWSRIINTHPELDGIEFRYSETLETHEGAKPCPEWCEVVIYRKDRSRPIVVREYLDEVYRPPFKARGKDYTITGPWQTHTKRFLRHKALIQGARIAFGFAGIYDEDEAGRIIEGEARRVEPARDYATEHGNVAALSDNLRSAGNVDTEAGEVVDAEFTEGESADSDEPAASGDGCPVSAADVRLALERADSLQALEEAGDLIKELPEGERKDLLKLWLERRPELNPTN